MSYVSGVVLQVDLADDREADSGNSPIWKSIDEWLNGHESGPFRPLRDVTDGLVLHKHPQTYVCGGGYNYFPDEEFAAFVMALPWENPDNVVLLINPEEGPTMVFTPRTTAPESDIRAAFLAGIGVAESGDVARFNGWNDAADDYVKNRGR